MTGGIGPAEAWRQVADDLVLAVDWIYQALDLHPEDELWGMWQERVAPALDRYVERCEFGPG